MKKVVVLLLVLTFGFTAAYADGVSFGAWTRTIYNVAQGSSDANQNISQSIGPKWWAGGLGGSNGTGGLYASLNLNVQGAVLGYHIGWETDGGTLATVPGHFLNFNISVNMIPDLLTFSVGKISSDQFRVFKDATDDPNGDRNWLIGRFEVSGRSNLSNLSDGTAGTNGYDAAGFGLTAAQLVLAPKDSGLAIGVYMPFTQNASSSIQENVDNLFAAASYTIASVGKITVGTTPKTNEGNAGTGITRNIYLGFNLTAIKGFDLVLAGQYNINRNQADGQSNGFEANLGASFGVDIFNMGIALFLTAPSSTATTAYTGLGIDVNPSLNLGAVTVGVTGNLDFRLYSTTPATGTQTLSYMVYPWVKINAISTSVGFKYSGDNATGSNGSWSVPIAIDMGF